MPVPPVVQPMVPGSMPVPPFVQQQAPVVGQPVVTVNEPQSPPISQTMATSAQAQAPSAGQAVANWNEAQSPPLGSPVAKFEPAQSPSFGLPVAKFEEAQSPTVSQMVVQRTEPVEPAIGQEALREEQGTRHNTSYGNYSGVVHYKIKVKGSGRYLRQDIGDDAIIKCIDLATGDHQDDAFARFRLVPETDGRWRIRNTATHHYMWEYLVDKQVRGTSSLKDTYTSFELEPQADWSYRIKVRGSGNYLHEDVSTGILAGGGLTDNMGSFVLVPLECCEKCGAYQIEPACPPDRCSWLGDRCDGLRKLEYQAASAHHVLSAAVVAVVFAVFSAAA